MIRAYPRADAAWRAVTAELAAAIAPIPPDIAAGAIGAYALEFWSDAERHRVHRQDIRNARRTIVRGALPALAHDVAVRLADRFTAYRDEQMSLHDGAHETLDALHVAGVRLALITNGDGPGQRAKLTRFDLARRFHHIQIEGELGIGKPDERAYRHALGTLGVAAADTWMVGDNLEWEVAAPQRLGIHAIWCDHAAEGLPADTSIRPDRMIRSLAELLDPSLR